MSFCKECGGYSEQPIRNEIDKLTQALQIAKDALNVGIECLDAEAPGTPSVIVMKEALKDIEKVLNGVSE